MGLSEFIDNITTPELRQIYWDELKEMKRGMAQDLRDLAEDISDIMHDREPRHGIGEGSSETPAPDEEVENHETGDNERQHAAGKKAKKRKKKKDKHKRNKLKQLKGETT